jgi:predicted metalloprotease with PDZ domain
MSGLDFDWGFVGQQKMIHDAMCAESKVLRRYASTSLREVIDDQVAEIKKDKQTLDRLVDRLKDEEYREMRGGDRASNQDDRASSRARRTGRSGADNQRAPYLDEFEFAEADFTTTARLTKGEIGRASLGLQLDREQSDCASLAKVRPDGPAAKAGLQAGDTILAINGHEVTSPDDLRQQLSRMKPGDDVQLVIDRSEFSANRIPLNADNSNGIENERSGRSGQRSSEKR